MFSGRSFYCGGSRTSLMEHCMNVVVFENILAFLVKWFRTGEEGVEINPEM